MIGIEKGKILLDFAKTVVHSSLFNEKINISDKIKKFDQKQGVFVTIHKNGQLRGCIGFVIGYFPLYEGIINAAKSALFEDHRFSPVTKDEWKDLEIEISILTIPESINVSPDQLPKEIEIGKDGLICEFEGQSGLLLPQVAPEWNWNSEELLNHTCEKAGLPQNTWKNPDCTIKKFQAEIFK